MDDSGEGARVQVRRTEWAGGCNASHAGRTCAPIPSTLVAGTLRSDVVHPAGPLTLGDLMSILPMVRHVPITKSGSQEVDTVGPPPAYCRTQLLNNETPTRGCKNAEFLRRFSLYSLF